MPESDARSVEGTVSLNRLQAWFLHCDLEPNTGGVCVGGDHVRAKEAGLSPVPNKSTVSVDVKQHFNQVCLILQ